MKLLGRALFFRAGLRDQVRDEIERQHERGRNSIARLEDQLKKVQESSEAGERTLRQLARRYDDLVQKYEVATEQLALQRVRFDELREYVQLFDKAHLQQRVTALERARRDDHEEQLRELTSELEAQFPLHSLAAHAQQVAERSPLMEDPYPHAVFDGVLPDALHTRLFEARPPSGFWRDGQEGRQNWTIGEDLAPLRTEAAWSFMDDVVVPQVLTPVLTGHFKSYLRSHSSRKAVYKRSGGRLMLRRPGYHFEPHLDPRRALLTALFYFGRPTDIQEGTKLFRSNDPIPETHRGVYYPLREGKTCEFVKMVRSRPNSILAFASRVGLHGADIPADAQPPTLERYAYQFYIGIARLN